MSASQHPSREDSLAVLEQTWQPPLALTYDDVLLLPQYSEVLPHEADTQTSLGPNLRLGLPILSAAMDTVTEQAMAVAMAQAGGLGILHKNMSPTAQADLVAKVQSAGSPPLQVGAATGVGEAGLARADVLVAAGVDLLVVDTAHGHSAGVLAAVRTLRRRYPRLSLAAGNVATAAGARDLALAGADVVKVGIGPGSICTTRSVSGVGVPQLSAVAAVAQAMRALEGVCRPVAVVADGGIQTSGDITKALAAGAQAVMVGSLLAGAAEAAGSTQEVDGQTLRSYRGMGSLPAMQAGSADRYFQAGAERAPQKLVAEGVSAQVPCSGPVAQLLYQLGGGLRAGMGYVGAKDLAALRARAQFVRQSGAGLFESRVHGVMQSAHSFSVPQK